MKCFYHQSADAVGSCKNCSRGLCPDCAAEALDGLACRGRCEATVEQVSALISRNAHYASSGPKAGSVYKGMGIVGMAVGVALLLLSLTGRNPSVIRSLPSVIFIAGGIAAYILGRRVGRAWDRDIS